MPAILRLAGLPARSLIALLSAILLLPIILASLPALLVMSFTTDGPARCQTMTEQIITWSRILLVTRPDERSTPPRGTRRDGSGTGRRRV
ncbi:hypothetical protein [Streptomyces broussonetiae]|uniref:Uncharacterized protein n=1 Tax=Streptomyces broussonetiae TaxID=2686304 RepID=A0A6I6MPD0_9ACTN|nr:hypothetical protein [Streptomyces broussonetiae]QHA02258.1 hypothetical protein GQF42_02015 [Streptomyces broussonetiae]